MLCIRQVIAFTLSLDSSFVISGSASDSKKIYGAVSCVLHYAFFFDSLSSDNTACLRRSASKAKCTVNGAIIRAHRKRVRLRSRRVKNGVHPTRPDPTRPDPTRPDPTRPKTPPFHHSTATTVSLRFTERTPGKGWWEQLQLNMSSAYRDMLNSLRHSTSFHYILFKKISFSLVCPS